MSLTTTSAPSRSSAERAPAVALAEAVEDVGEEVGVDAGARVRDRHLGLAVRARESHAHAPARGRELDGVREEVPEDLLQALGVARDLRGRVVEARLNLDLFGLRGGAHRLDGGAHDRAQLDAPRVETHLPRDDARHVEQVVDDLLLRAR